MEFTSLAAMQEAFAEEFTRNDHCICIVDADARIRQVTPAFASLLGYAPGELEGRAFVELVHQQDEVLKFTGHLGMYQFKRSSEVPIEIELCAARGHAVPVKLTSKLARSIDGAVLGGIGFFKSLQSKAEKELFSRKIWETEQTLQNVLENSGDAIVVADGNGRIVIANEALFAMLGFTREEILGRHLIELSPYDGTFRTFDGKEVVIGEEYVNRQVAYATELFETGRLTYELYYKRKDEKLVPVETTISLLTTPGGEFKGSITICRDITKRLKAQEERDRLAKAVEEVDEIVVISDQGGMIQYVNPSFERITGYMRDEVIGQHESGFRLSEQPGFDQSFMQHTVGRGDVWKGTVTGLKKNGGRYEAQVSLTPIQDARGDVTNIVAVVRDITEELRLQSRMRQVQKMQAIGTLAGGIAHEFNNILGSVIGYTEMAIDESGSETAAAGSMQQVLRAANRAKGVVEQLLALSRRGGQGWKPMRIAQVVGEAVALIKQTIPSNIDVAERYEAGDAVLLGESLQISQVLINLCSNAVEAMASGGGQLTVLLREAQFERLDIADLEEGDYIEILVRDTGTGIAKQVSERMFDPFYTTRGPGRASGLGLSVALGIVRSHGGTITFDTTDGSGSTFTVLLPKMKPGDVSQDNRR